MGWLVGELVGGRGAPVDVGVGEGVGGVPSSQGLCPWEEEVGLMRRWGPARPPGGDGDVVSSCGFISLPPELFSEVREVTLACSWGAAGPPGGGGFCIVLPVSMFDLFLLCIWLMKSSSGCGG